MPTAPASASVPPCAARRWPRPAALAETMLACLLPACCALCGGAAAQALCDGCRQQYCGTLAAARCRQCGNLPGGTLLGGTPLGGTPLGGTPPADGAAGLCGACLSAPPAFDVTLVAADYAAPLDQLVLQLKFSGRLALAPLLAALLRDAVLRQPGFVLPTVLCPVPLGPRRLAERGFNQALEIARPLARSLGVPLRARWLLRPRDTAAQSSMAPDQRQHNIADAFALADDAGLQGCHVGLVDDVMTSGQTLQALAALCKRYGAARVSNLVFARTPPHVPL